MVLSIFFYKNNLLRLKIAKMSGKMVLKTEKLAFFYVYVVFLSKKNIIVQLLTLFIHLRIYEMLILMLMSIKIEIKFLY